MEVNFYLHSFQLKFNIILLSCQEKLPTKALYKYILVNEKKWFFKTYRSLGSSSEDWPMFDFVGLSKNVILEKYYRFYIYLMQENPDLE